MKNKLLKIYEYLKNKFEKKPKLYIALLFIFISIIILNFYLSYASFNNIFSMPLVNSKVGNTNLRNYDYILSIYLEDPSSSEKKYFLANKIPSAGYKYSRYECDNNSVLIYDEKNKTTTASLDKKDSCSIYFDIEVKADLILKIIIKDNDKYIVNEEIPESGYRFIGSECLNNSNLIYDSSNRKVKINSQKKDECAVFFDKE